MSHSVYVFFKISVKSVEDKAGFFAERLYDAIAGIGTRDRQLIRVVVSRCEIDMQSIKQAYQKRFGKSLEQDISVRISIFYISLLIVTHFRLTLFGRCGSYVIQIFVLRLIVSRKDEEV